MLCSPLFCPIISHYKSVNTFYSPHSSHLKCPGFMFSQSLQFTSEQQNSLCNSTSSVSFSFQIHDTANRFLLKTLFNHGKFLNLLQFVKNGTHFSSLLVLYFRSQLVVFIFYHNFHVLCVIKFQKFWTSLY